jgi:hypothetical protein
LEFFHRPELLAFELRFQIAEEKKVAGTDIRAVGWLRSRVAGNAGENGMPANVSPSLGAGA